MERAHDESARPDESPRGNIALAGIFGNFFSSSRMVWAGTLAVVLFLAPLQVDLGRLSPGPTNALAATGTQGGINVEPSARPNPQYHGINPDSWWCASPSQCTNGADPLARINTEMGLAQQ